MECPAAPIESAYQLAGQGERLTRSLRVSPNNTESRCGLFFPVFCFGGVFSIRSAFRLNSNMTEKGRKSAYLMGIFMVF